MKKVDLSDQFIDSQGKPTFHPVVVDGRYVPGTEPIYLSDLLAQCISEKSDPVKARKVPGIVGSLNESKTFLADESDIKDIDECVTKSERLTSLAKGMIQLALDNAKEYKEA